MLFPLAFLRLAFIILEVPGNQIASLERVVANFSTQKLNVSLLCTLTSCSFT